MDYQASSMGCRLCQNYAEVKLFIYNVLYVIDKPQASAVTGYRRGGYSIRGRGAAEASN